MWRVSTTKKIARSTSRPIIKLSSKLGRTEPFKLRAGERKSGKGASSRQGCCTGLDLLSFLTFVSPFICQYGRHFVKVAAVAAAAATGHAKVLLLLSRSISVTKSTLKRDGKFCGLMALEAASSTNSLTRPDCGRSYGFLTLFIASRQPKTASYPKGLLLTLFKAWRCQKSLTEC